MQPRCDSMILDFISICHHCPNWDRSISGKPPCKINGRYFADNAADGICPDTLNRFNLSSGELAELQPAAPPQPEIKPIPRDQWTDRVQSLAELAQPGETGIGQVVTRLIATSESRLQAAAVIAEEFGAVSTIVGAFKWLTGKECGCGDKAARLDMLYPLP